MFALLFVCFAAVTDVTLCISISAPCLAERLPTFLPSRSPCLSSSVLPSYINPILNQSPYGSPVLTNPPVISAISSIAPYDQIVSIPPTSFAPPPYALPVPPVLPATLPVPAAVSALPAAPVPALSASCAAPCPLINPFLPVASPVSALAPSVSPCLPPALPINSSCNFLRKIPIPPPYI